MIIRTQRKVPGAYIPRDTAHDYRLSPESLGLLIHLLAHGDSWDCQAGPLQHEINQRRGARRGRQTLRRLLKELEEAGYLSRSRRRTSSGEWYWDTVIRDWPVDATSGRWATGESATGGSPVDRSAVDRRTKDSRTKESSTKSSSGADAPSESDDDDYTTQQNDGREQAMIERVAARFKDAQSEEIRSQRSYITAVARDAGLPTDSAALDRYEAALREHQAAASAEAEAAEAEKSRKARETEERHRRQMEASEADAVEKAYEYLNKL